VLHTFEGFFHVDRQRSGGKTDYCVIHFSRNNILAIRLFLPSGLNPIFDLFELTLCPFFVICLNLIRFVSNGFILYR
jgi:hypothetical protein